MKQKPYTPPGKSIQDKRRLRLMLRLRKEGYSYSRISRMLNLSRDRARQLLQKAELLGYTVIVGEKRNALKDNPERVAKVRKHWQKGCSISGVARELGYSAAFVKQVVAKYKLPYKIPALTHKQRQAVCTAYLSGVSGQKLADKYKVGIATIFRCLSDGNALRKDQ